jgi:hypothetical protein
MGLLTILAATAEHAAEEHSETPFFVAGIMLAVFAVVISVVGFTRPDFPGSDGAARVVIGAGSALVLLTMAMIIYIAS